MGLAIPIMLYHHVRRSGVWPDAIPSGRFLTLG